jgi:HD-GYP domain-containing protein (c-di-GMP phosphodiesterase class II)
VADAFDTMTTDRAYRSALSVSYALHELRACTRSQFCPKAVEAFIIALREHRATPLGSSLPLRDGNTRV